MHNRFVRFVVLGALALTAVGVFADVPERPTGLPQKITSSSRD